MDYLEEGLAAALLRKIKQAIGNFGENHKISQI